MNYNLLARIFGVKLRCLAVFFLLVPLATYSQVGSVTPPTRRVGKIDSTGMITLRIDPQNARGANVSQVFDEVKFIPLETTKESLFGNINMLSIVKNRFVIFDYDTRSVLIFGTDGKYKTKIDASKLPKDEADKTKAEFYGYQMAAEGADSLIAIYTPKYFCYFDLDGKLLKKVLHKDAGLNANYPLGDGETVVLHGWGGRGKDSTAFSLAIANKTDTTGYLPFPMSRYQNDQFWGGSHIYNYGVKGEVLFIDFYNYNLYKATSKGVSLAYRIFFPANQSLPVDFTSNPVYKNKRSEYFQKNQKVFYGISSSYIVGDNLYLQMHSYGYDKELKKSIIYNLKTSELTSLQDLEPDSLSSFLPVTDAGAFYDFSNHGFHQFKDGRFYTSYSSLAMFKFKEQLGDKYDKFSPEMQAYFKTQDRKSNPVIIQLKPKQH